MIISVKLYVTMDFFHFGENEVRQSSEDLSSTLQPATGDLAQQIMDEMLYNTRNRVNSSIHHSNPVEYTRESHNGDPGRYQSDSSSTSDDSFRRRTFDKQIHAMGVFYPQDKERGDSFVIVSDKDNMLRAYNPSDGLSPLFVLGQDIESRHRDRITCIKCYQPPGEDTVVVVSGSKDKTLRVWVVQSSSCFKELRDGHEDTVWCVDIVSKLNMEPLVVSGGIDGFLIVWSMLRGVKLREVYLGEQRAIFCLSSYVFQGAAMVLFGGEDEMITMWSISSGEVVRTYHGHSDAIYSVSVMTNYCSEPHRTSLRAEPNGRHYGHRRQGPPNYHLEHHYWHAAKVFFYA